MTYRTCPRFVRRQNHLLEPLIDLSLFRVSVFRTSVIANLSSAFMGFGGMFFLAPYVQLVRGQSPLRAGLWATPWAAGAVVGGLHDGLSPVAARAAHGTLEGAAEAIRHLSAHDGDVLLAGARDAFTRGLDVAALA